MSGKKRKIDLGKSIDKDRYSCRPSTTVQFEEISIEIKVINDFVAGYPTRLGESNTTYYIAQSDYEKCMKDQKKLGATISRLERAYSSLT